MCRIRPSKVLYPALRAGYKYKKLLLNDGDFMNEFKLNWTINNFATIYNLKQLLCQQYQTTSDNKASEINFIQFIILDSR